VWEIWINNDEMGRMLGFEADQAEYADAIRKGLIAINSRDLRSRIKLLAEIFSTLELGSKKGAVAELIRVTQPEGSIIQRLCSGDRNDILQIKRELFENTGGVWS
jgi:hypothetical protein